VTPGGVVTLDTDSGDIVADTGASVALDPMSFSTDPDALWQPLSLNSPFSALNNPQWQNPEFMVTASGRVFIRGIVNKGSPVAVGDVIATMPSSFGPNKLNLCPPRNVRFG